MKLDMAMFHQAFFEEATDALAELEQHLLQLEDTPEDEELLNSIFRCAHSLKGGSATFGFTDIAHFTHGLETLLDKVRNRETPVTPPLTQILFASLDQLNALLAVAKGEGDAAPDSSELTARIEAAIRGEFADAPDAPTQPKAAEQADDEEDTGWGVWGMPQIYHLRVVPGADILRQGNDPLQMLKQLADAGEILSCACDTASLPALASLNPETCYLGWEITFRSDWDEARLLEIFDFIADESEITLKTEEEGKREAEGLGIRDKGLEIKEESAAKAEHREPEASKPEISARPAPSPSPKAEAPKAAPRQVAASSETQTLRVSTDKVDKLINLVGELIINQSMLNEVVNNFSMSKLPRLMEAVAQMERASRELQERVMAVRMLPIKYAFGRFPRLVHDLAAKCGKHIELNTSGEDTELDKSVIEAIADPLTHLIRNSIDHGLEPPDERRAAGKPETGNVHLHAFQEGGNIIIEISDDGRGLNRDRILRKAIDRGLASEDDAALSDEAIYNFIFSPGFSTAAQVTDLSGRGVGMDIVKQGVQALGGSVSLSSVPGKGTRFRIRLPLTMAILEGLSLGVGGEVYILPLTSIVESIQPRMGDVRRIAGHGEVAVVRGEVLPILRLYEAFGAEARITDPTRGLLVIVENDRRKVALLVDELIGQSQVVIKSLEANYRKVDGIAGATILGDGRVALIVDIPGLLRQAQGISGCMAA